MKKGLRPNGGVDFAHQVVRTVDLMKKGLRPLPEPSYSPYRVRTVDLMKKGLRLAVPFRVFIGFGQNRRPDEEGIKTSWLSPLFGLSSEP